MLAVDNITYAKRCIVDLMWKEARLEGIAVTFPQTNEIYEGRSVSGLAIEQVNVINNLKHAWQFVFDSIEYPIDFRWISQLHYEIGQNSVINMPGELRPADVKVTTGLSEEFVPPIPDKKEVSEHVQQIASIADPVDRAVEMFCYLCKAQVFWDGNERTAQLSANKILISSGQGILSIDPDQDMRFRNLLADYYLHGKDDGLKSFLIGECIDCPDIAPAKIRPPETRDEFIRRETLPLNAAPSPADPAARQAQAEPSCSQQSAVRHRH